MPETRAAAHQAWGLEINNMWGCVEVGHIGIECDAHEGLHMSDDLIITEFVDHAGKPTGDPDAIDRVLVTSLFGRTLPLIRYESTSIRWRSVRRLARTAGSSSTKCIKPRPAQGSLSSLQGQSTWRFLSSS
jgi:phenylacetate-coenzyme A ligase PaaK-like adenylate-forming protein